jgi:hypothetical protein
VKVSVQLLHLIGFYVPMIVHRDQIMKREDQQDATIRCLLLTSVSTCFGHHYAHLQESKGPVTAFGAVLASYNATPHNRYQTTSSRTRTTLQMQ